MGTNIDNRRELMDWLRRELVGPWPTGEPIDCSREIAFESAVQAQGPWKQAGSGDEILTRDNPGRRYGVGVLHPFPPPPDESADDPSGTGEGGAEDLIASKMPDAGQTGSRGLKSGDQEATDTGETAVGGTEPDQDDFDLSTAYTYEPSSMAISFLAELPEGSRLCVEVPGTHGASGFPANGTYRRLAVKIGGTARDWWARAPLGCAPAEFAASELGGDRTRVEKRRLAADPLELSVEVHSRPFGNQRTRLLTVCLVNRSRRSKPVDENCLFQAYFTVSVLRDTSGGKILPYPGRPGAMLDAEERSLDLLYRRSLTYAVGHGCSADWECAEGSLPSRLSAECLPSAEVPNTTPEVVGDDGRPVEVSMAALAGLVPGDDGYSSLETILSLYERWILARQREVPGLPKHHQDTAREHLARCGRCLERARAGLAYLGADPVARKAFELANYAVLLQQVCVGNQVRTPALNPRTGNLDFAPAYSAPDPRTPPLGRGGWRPFQAAFLLTAVKPVADPGDVDRETVDLIWFPTGGGKTEAYLGLAAYSIFLRRLRGAEDSGVNVIMRYTLRLLATQQFQRACCLAVAMEYVRRKTRVALGPAEISVGMWLGGSISPNTRSEALETLRLLQRPRRGTKNKFVLRKCPWCGARLGPVGSSMGRRRNTPAVLGYENNGGTVVFRCPDRKCDFSDHIPVYVIDEDIYQRCPDLVIGTVDKFAMLAWRPEARSIFGIGRDGERAASPPGLVIQDELHLISGPLGSVVGLYEALIERLCTDRRETPHIKPKIICSTATIRRYGMQIRALYSRERVALFPPPGLEAGDSFFGRFDKEPGGTMRPGRVFVGVNAPGLGSMQTVQVRTFTALLQAPVRMATAERDPWWTLVVFFNSLRELGTTLTLFQSDIPDYGETLGKRLGLKQFSSRARQLNLQQLMGDLSSDEVPEAIAALEVSTTQPDADAVDVCLASSMIEVGIDIDRLSLMAVVGQPKSTSQYIQVTGRVGRKWREQPGLVVTLYSPSKPRDRSHFEKFRSYHERLYANVEPASVTPFAAPVLDRALHAVMSALARQTGEWAVAESPDPPPDKLLAEFEAELTARARLAGSPGEDLLVQREFQRRCREWHSWQRLRWEGRPGWEAAEDAPLLVRAGTYVKPAWRPITWPTPQSMRNVDAACEGEVMLPQGITGGQQDD